MTGLGDEVGDLGGCGQYFVFYLFLDALGAGRDLNNEEVKKRPPTAVCGDGLLGKRSQHEALSPPSSCQTSKVSACTLTGRPCPSLISDSLIPGHSGPSMFFLPGEVLAQSADPCAGREQCKGLLLSLVEWGLLTTCALVLPGRGVCSTPGWPHPGQLSWPLS